MNTSAEPEDKGEFVRRSWFLPKAAADGLAKASDDLHFETRAPKSATLAAIIETGLAHLDEARRRLNQPGA
jgi:hypothetical protein